MFVNPSSLSANELKSLVSIFKYNKPLLISNGFVHTNDMIINWRALDKLAEYALLNRLNGKVILTKSGQIIARKFVNKFIIGYD